MRFLSDKRILFSVIVAILILFALITYNRWGFYLFGGKIESREFAGHVNNIEGNLIYVSGNFVSSDHPETRKSGSDIVVEINSETKFKRTLLYLPTKSELAKTNGVFDPKNLKRDVNEVNFNELVNDYNSRINYLGGITIYARTQKNIYGTKKILASEIEYNIAAKSQDE